MASSSQVFGMSAACRQTASSVMTSRGMIDALKSKLQRKLNPARVFGLADRSELRRVERDRRREKVCAIQQIECLGPQHQAHRFADDKSLRKRYIPGFEAWRPILRKEASGVAESEARRIDERGAIEVIVQPLADAAWRAARDAGTIGPLSGGAAIERAGCIGGIQRDR